MRSALKSRIGLLAAFLATAALAAAGLTACSGGAPAFKSGEHPFKFDPATITSLEIAKADPATGDRWAARLTRSPGGEWEIPAGPGGGPLLDRFAHSSFINHLLDTLGTLQVSGPAPKGPPESFGLAPPRFALRFGGFEIRFGSGSYAQIGQAIYELKGAAFKMLENIESFDSLRQQALFAPLIPDDVDEIEVFLRKKSVFYAQREGETWTDRKHRPVGGDTGAALEGLVHQRIQKFIDDPALSSRNIAGLDSLPFWKVSLKDRQGKETLLRLLPTGIAAVSSRPGASFESFPQLLAAVESLAARKKR